MRGIVILLRRAARFYRARKFNIHNIDSDRLAPQQARADSRAVSA